MNVPLSVLRDDAGTLFFAQAALSAQGYCIVLTDLLHVWLTEADTAQLAIIQNQSMPRVELAADKRLECLRACLLEGAGTFRRVQRNGAADERTARDLADLPITASFAARANLPPAAASSQEVQRVPSSRASDLDRLVLHAKLEARDGFVFEWEFVCVAHPSPGLYLRAAIILPFIAMALNAASGGGASEDLALMRPVAELNGLLAARPGLASQYDHALAQMQHLVAPDAHSELQAAGAAADVAHARSPAGGASGASLAGSPTLFRDALHGIADTGALVPQTRIGASDATAPLGSQGVVGLTVTRSPTRKRARANTVSDVGDAQTASDTQTSTAGSPATRSSAHSASAAERARREALEAARIAAQAAPAKRRRLF